MLQSNLFMNNVHNALFTLITVTAFESSFFSSEASFQLLHCPKASSVGFLSGIRHKCFEMAFWIIPPPRSLDASTHPWTLFCRVLLETIYRKTIHSQIWGWFGQSPPCSTAMF